MSGLGKYNTENVEASGVNEPMPEGFYPAVITKSELKDTSSGGAGLALEVQILEGKHKNRKVWPWINLEHPTSAACVEFGLRDLEAIRQATDQAGHDDQDSAEFHDIPIVVKLKTKPAQNGYEAGNDVSGWLPPTPENIERVDKTEAANTQSSSSSSAGASSATPFGKPEVKEEPAKVVEEAQETEAIVNEAIGQDTGAKPSWLAGK